MVGFQVHRTRTEILHGKFYLFFLVPYCREQSSAPLQTAAVPALSNVLREGCEPTLIILGTQEVKLEEAEIQEDNSDCAQWKQTEQTNISCTWTKTSVGGALETSQLPKRWHKTPSAFLSGGLVLFPKTDSARSECSWLVSYLEMLITMDTLLNAILMQNALYYRGHFPSINALSSALEA